jgi:glycosidase
MSTVTTQVVVQDRRDQVRIHLDPATGLPVSFTFDELTVPVSVQATLVTEGIEIEGHPFGLAYADTIDLDAFTLVSGDIRHVIDGYDEVFTVRTRVEGWEIDWEYRIRQRSPRLEIQWLLTPSTATGTLRNLHVSLAFAPASLDGWTIEAPGAGIRAGVDAAGITSPVAASEPAFSGSGIVVAHHADSRRAVLLWPFSRTELLRSQIQAVDGALRMRIATGLAARIGSGEHLRYGSMELDAFSASWDEIRPQIAAWFPVVGIASPADTPHWVPNASIFEVQIGTSRFWNGWNYQPYPTMRDLYNDLGRIAGLGFDCIQIMPRQPFPSYNVYDYDDVTLSYGDEDDLITLVDAAHALGIRVILDILMHGVIDAEIIHRAADRVRNGPYFQRLNEGTGIVHDPEFTAWQGQDYLVAWSRHILDFENDWAGGSPGTHPLVSEHPEWFMRDSSGEIIGVYTKAFDVANTDWQRYFTTAALNLVRRLGIDGFRFDAPTYNEFPNWSPATEKRASASELGAVPYFQQLRYEMRQVAPDAVMYTEPAGVLFRQSMDITYNYDEHWLFHAVLRPEFALQRHPLGVRHARDLAEWFRNKAAALPAGAITARHIDSHDSFWWPLPGFKWRREQYGLEATRALLAVWSLTGGVYMTFIGGEEGIEDDLRRVHRLRRTIPEFGHGEANYDAVTCTDDGIFAVARYSPEGSSLLLVNLSRNAIDTTVSVDTAALRLDRDTTYTVTDAWSDEVLSHSGSWTWPGTALEAFDLHVAPYQVRALTIRRG